MDKAPGQPNWNWIISNLPLKQFTGGDNVTWSLQPAIALSHPTGHGPDPNIKLLVDSEKSFQFSEELGWNWHKSWKLPTLSIQLEIKDVDTDETLLCPKDIFVHVFAVKAVVDQNNKLYLADVGLKGSNKLELIDGKAVFQTLKFASTSYNNEGVKFHLLVCLYLQISEDTKPKILKAIVSPPIFVDSRKSVRESEKFSDNKLNLYIEPFYPDNFTKKFIKRETKKKESIEEDIQNSVDGLYSYLTAPNIRHKVKHPIFLSIRFSNCISLFYNPRLGEAERQNFVEVLQNLLYEDMEAGQSQRDIKPDESIFVMYIDKDSLEDKNKKKKILELLSPVRCKSLTVIFGREEIPGHFVKFTDLKWMIELYSKSYSKLIAKAKNYSRGDEENEDEDQPKETIAPPERQVINLATQAPNPGSHSDWTKYFEQQQSAGVEEDPKKKVKTENNSQAPNMMEARTITYREQTTKMKDRASPQPHPQQQQAQNNNQTMQNEPTPQNSQGGQQGQSNQFGNNQFIMNLLQKQGGGQNQEQLMKQLQGLPMSMLQGFNMNNQGQGQGQGQQQNSGQPSGSQSGSQQQQSSNSNMNLQSLMQQFGGQQGSGQQNNSSSQNPNQMLMMLMNQNKMGAGGAGNSSQGNSSTPQVSTGGQNPGQQQQWNQYGQQQQGGGQQQQQGQQQNQQGNQGSTQQNNPMMNIQQMLQQQGGGSKPSTATGNQAGGNNAMLQQLQQMMQQGNAGGMNLPPNIMNMMRGMMPGQGGDVKHEDQQHHHH